MRSSTVQVGSVNTLVKVLFTLRCKPVATLGSLLAYNYQIPNWEEKANFFDVYRFITARLAKRAKVMFSLCMSVHRGGPIPQCIGSVGPPPPGPAPPPAPPAPFWTNKVLDKKFWTKKFWTKKFWTKKFWTKKFWTKKFWTKNWTNTLETFGGGGRGQYASCGHAGGLSCSLMFSLLLWSFSLSLSFGDHVRTKVRP